MRSTLVVLFLVVSCFVLNLSACREDVSDQGVVVQDPDAPRWSQDGTAIFWIGEGFSMNRCDLKTGRRTTWELPERCFDFAVSPDGRSAVTHQEDMEGVADLQYRHTVIIIDLETRRRRTLCVVRESMDEVHWPSADRIVFASDRIASIFQLSPRDGKVREIVRQAGTPVCTADGRGFLYRNYTDHGWYFYDFATGKSNRFGQGKFDTVNDSRIVYVSDRLFVYFEYNPTSDSSQSTAVDLRTMQTVSASLPQLVSGENRLSPDLAHYFTFHHGHADTIWSSYPGTLRVADTPPNVLALLRSIEKQK